jgi:hypothetical protein
MLSAALARLSASRRRARVRRRLREQIADAAQTSGALGTGICR